MITHGTSRFRKSLLPEAISCAMRSSLCTLEAQRAQLRCTPSALTLLWRGAALLSLKVFWPLSSTPLRTRDFCTTSLLMNGATRSILFLDLLWCNSEARHMMRGYELGTWSRRCWGYLQTVLGSKPAINR